MKILIVDDHEENLYLLQSLLQGNGHEVFSAENGVEALKILEAGGIEMIISDILMPIMDGFQLCRNVKTSETLRNIPFIVYTATYTDSQDECLALNMGADRFIVKPCEPDVFMQIVHEAIAAARRGECSPKEKQPCEAEISRMYSERLVKKLENKVLEAEQELRKRQEAEKALQMSLDEKTQLILELYHRTRNNMQVIISILTLYAGTYKEEYVQAMVKNTVNRIQAMAMVHDKLYQSQNLSSINMDEYIFDLSQLLEQSHNLKPGKVKLSFDLEPVPALIDIVVPCGLVLNELISNALEHAFPDDRVGEIQIGLHRTAEDGIVSISVSDNGVGLPAGFDYRNSTTIGLPTVIAIVKLQLQGDIVFKEEKGLSCTIRFQNNLYRKRI